MSTLPLAEGKRGERYALPAIGLHWVIAVLIIGMLFLGYYMVGIPKGTPDRALYFNLHKSFGVLAGVLILMRLGWRLTHAAPPMPNGMPHWSTRAARWSHRLQYLCMVLQPATGYLSSSFNKYGVKFFGFALPNWAWEDRQLRDLFMGFHQIIAVVFAALIALHVLAAFKHLLVDRDRVFSRMLP
ncbi:cytochrome b [Undibacterium arcticum]|uniref:Cytochrome b n=1 Tax=Undibacterium arcticum TaxID=1762892 RepID=A0ABV7EZZ4_9BURK